MNFFNNEVTLVDKDLAVKTVNLAHHTKDCGLILYFYPKDSTTGCTVQARDFSDLKDKFASLGYKIIGVSRDSVKSHQNFIQKQALTIDLISDHDQTLCQYFDVIKEKKLYGKTYLGIVRTTFVFDKHHNLIKQATNVKAKGHADELLQFLSDYSA